MSSLRFQVLNGVIDVVNFEAKTCIAVSSEFSFISGGNEFEQNAVNIESSHNVSGSQSQAKYLRIERDRLFNITDIVEDAVEVKSRQNTNLLCSKLE